MNAVSPSASELVSLKACGAEGTRQDNQDQLLDCLARRDFPALGNLALLLNVQAVASLCDCSPRHIYRLADSGRMPASRKLGGLVRWSRAEIETWIAGGCKPVRTVKVKGV